MPPAAQPQRVSCVYTDDSELVSRVLLVPCMRVVSFTVGCDSLIAVLQLRWLDRILVTVPQTIAASLIVRIQLHNSARRQACNALHVRPVASARYRRCEASKLPTRSRNTAPASMEQLRIVGACAECCGLASSCHCRSETLTVCQQSCGAQSRPLRSIRLLSPQFRCCGSAAMALILRRFAAVRCSLLCSVHAPCRRGRSAWHLLADTMRSEAATVSSVPLLTTSLCHRRACCARCVRTAVEVLALRVGDSLLLRAAQVLIVQRPALLPAETKQRGAETRSAECQSMQSQRIHLFCLASFWLSAACSVLHASLLVALACTFDLSTEVENR